MADKNLKDKILIIGPSWIGDMVMAQSLLISLKNQNPNYVIDMLSPVWAADIVSRMSEVANIITLDIPHGKLSFKKRQILGKNLQQNNYSKAIIIPRSFKSALIPFFAKIPVRIGFKGEMRYGLLTDIRPLDKTILSQTVQKMVALGLDKSAKLPPSIPSPKLNVDNKQTKLLLTKFNIKQNQTIIGLMPGAEYGKAKQWPVEYFTKVANNADIKNYQVVIFGSEKDQAIGDKIAKNSKAINLCGKTSLTEAVDLLSSCQKVICNDSGLMHIAAAVGCEIIAIYGSSSPNYTPPLTNNKTIYYLNLKCSPCFNRACRLNTYECLNDIMPSQISL